MRSSAGSRRARGAAKHSAQDPAHYGAGAGKDSLHGLAGSTHDVADRRHGAPLVALGLHLHRMNDDLTTLVIVGVVAIADVCVMRVRVVFMPIVLLRRRRSGD